MAQTKNQAVEVVTIRGEFTLDNPFTFTYHTRTCAKLRRVTQTREWCKKDTA